MLEQLFGSKTRLRLMRIFFNNPAEYYYIRELTRKLDTQINAIRRELENLEEVGLVIAVPAAQLPSAIAETKADGDELAFQRKKFYTLSTDWPLLEELKALMLKAQVLTDESLVTSFERIGVVKYVALTGVFTGRRERSVDVLVVGTVNRRALQRIIAKLEKDTDHELHFTVLPPAEFEYRRNVGDRFVYDILENPRVVLIDKYGLPK